MPVYHIVLFKLKPGVTTSQLNRFRETTASMVGKIPGLLRFESGPPHVSTAHRSKGFDMGIVAVLDKPETIKVYAEHPAHLEVHKMREELCEDTLAYDLEYDDL